jgi:hypothetical protein
MSIQKMESGVGVSVIVFFVLLADILELSLYRESPLLAFFSGFPHMEIIENEKSDYIISKTNKRKRLRVCRRKYFPDSSRLKKVENQMVIIPITSPNIYN